MDNIIKQNIYWLDLSRFDVKTNKSPWLEMSEVLCKNGYKVTLLCGYQQKKYIPTGYQLNIHYLKALQFAGLFRYSLLINMIFWLALNAHQEDIVIVRPGSLIAGFIIKCICKCHIHMDIRTVPVEVHSLRDRIDQLLFWKAPLLIFKNMPDSYSFITIPLKNSVEKEFRTKFTKFVIWSSGVASNIFVTAKPKPRIGIEQERFILFYHGTITPNRGIDRVIQAISILESSIRDNIIFKIVGQGYDEDRLKALSVKFGIQKHIQFCGYVPYEKIPEAIKSSDCCICPLPNLHDWNVSSPIKIFEYLACEKPVILTPIIAHESILSKDTPYVIWAKDDTYQSFAYSIESAYRNRCILSEKAKTAYDFIKKNYDWKIQGEKLIHHFKKQPIK